jgi:Zn-dependent peptidase ImmA (M78 family)
MVGSERAMTMLGTLLQTACTASGMPPELVARLARLDPARLREVLDGHAEPSAAELDRCARVFGVRLDDFLEGQAGNAPLSLLMRSSLEGGPAGVQEILTTEIHDALGEFLRVVRDIAEIERLLGVPPRPLPRLPLLPARRDEHAGERAARTVRQHLGLGLDPVPSVRAIAEQELSIRVVWVIEDQVDRSLDGACTTDPRPAILVNLLEPERYPWRTRITLAHELCHLLFDQDAPGRRALVSPHGELRLFPGFAEIEQRARAFAACFLAPADGVRAVVGTEDPTSEVALRRVGERFGVGRVVAINRLHHVFRLSDDERRRMETRAGEPYDADFAGDRVDEPLGLRGGALSGLVHEGLRRGLLSGVRARKMLGLTVTEPLPFGDLDEGLRAPLVSRAEVIRRRADQLLAERWPDAGLQAVEARSEGTAWHVAVVGGGIGARAPAPRGYLLLSGTGDRVESDVAPV